MQQYKQQERTGLIILASGFGVIATILVMQYLSVSQLSTGGTILLSQEHSRAFERAAIPMFGTIMFATAIVVIGVHRILLSWHSSLLLQANGPPSTTSTIIAHALKRYSIVFWIALSIYAAVFLFASNTAIYSTDRISERFSASIPSYHLIGCCGQPGSFPVITVYASEHLGFLLIPANLMLLSFLPILVGINGCLLVDRIKRIKKQKAECAIDQERNKALSYAGISVGLFAGCPACAGNLFLSIAGIGGALTGTTTATALSSSSTMLAVYQPIMVFASVISLLAALFLNGRQQQNKDS